MNTAQYLPPEYHNALETLLWALDNAYEILDNLTKHCVYEGNLEFFGNTSKARDIPSPDCWRWNQAKSRKTVSITGGQVTFFKLAPRKTHQNSDIALPRLKIWKYCIKLNNREVFYCLWCEKGFKTPPNQNYTYNALNTLSLQDFQFLAPFMDPDSAAELWPSLVSQ